MSAPSMPPKVLDLTGELDQDVRVWLCQYEGQMWYANRDSDKQKAKGIEFCILEDSPASKWYSSLSEADKASWPTIKASLIGRFKAMETLKEKEHMVFQQLCQKKIKTSELLDLSPDPRFSGGMAPKLHIYLRDLLDAANRVPIDKVAEDVKCDHVWGAMPYPMYMLSPGPSGAETVHTMVQRLLVVPLDHIRNASGGQKDSSPTAEQRYRCRYASETIKKRRSESKSELNLIDLTSNSDEETVSGPDESEN
ncbi:hypothetical protein CBOM_04440 [Ceraceosorus bombacis]|uniref:Uncharacterized protein n=1 Tax=Ceraceosorus bombacis TaxID=401625 RepID=A0A0P1BP13_9BASI|nr:hypothetical protein CBOM_04440 [Ceraceosorus bombacis]